VNRPCLFGVHVDPLTMDDTVARCVQLIESRRFTQHAVLNAGKVVLMRDTPGLTEAVDSADVVSADGQSVVWAGRLLGVHFPERVTGIDLMGRLLTEAERRGYPVFFLGAKPDVLERFLAVCRQRYPSLVVAGYRDGYFEHSEAVARQIAVTAARVLFVGMSSPGKEKFVDDSRERLGGLLAVGVGGSFDVWAGVTRRAPEHVQRLGLEWLYRLVQEPARMWRRYLIGNLRFLGIVTREWRLQRRGRTT
jgi:N-acetylglucosaminyldiphosphoundecaprenol N-acetyl-beta-D-mannosaminyltransferase